MIIIRSLFLSSTPMDPHEDYIRLALTEARKSPPKPSNFCIGAVLVSPSQPEPVLTRASRSSWRITRTRNTAVCLRSRHGMLSLRKNLGDVLPDHCVIYTTMEPCALRLSGNPPCVDRILNTCKRDPGIRKVYVGVLEPENFVGVYTGRKKLENAGIEVVRVTGMEEEILQVATAGHVK
ncbi:hypothetical protein K461DRAFT_166234, partial [Myriangium duriaei CBS 260.36]